MSLQYEWLLDKNGQPDYAATAVAVGRGTHPAQIAAKEARARSEAEAAAEPVKEINTRANPNIQLFHGTDHIFAPGEMVEPRNPGSVSVVGRSNPEWKDKKTIYTTSSLEEAKTYAGNKATSRFAPVYEVSGGEPHSEYALLGTEPLLRHSGGFRRKYENTYVSRESMTPGRIVAWGESPYHKHLSPQFTAMVNAAAAMIGAPRQEIE